MKASYIRISRNKYTSYELLNQRFPAQNMEKMAYLRGIAAISGNCRVIKKPNLAVLYLR